MTVYISRDDSNALTHYGVLGMKWGVRKDSYGAKNVARTAAYGISRGARAATRSTVRGAKAVGRAAVKVLFATGLIYYHTIKTVSRLAFKAGQLIGEFANRRIERDVENRYKKHDPWAMA